MCWASVWRYGLFCSCVDADRLRNKTKKCHAKDGFRLPSCYLYYCGTQDVVALLVFHIRSVLLSAFFSASRHGCPM
jgi:hypothetical protein